MNTLGSIFKAIVLKKLVLVDLPEKGSNQHEVNGVAALRDFFGTEDKIREEIEWHYFSDDENPLHDPGQVTFYDARAASSERTGRSEWRMYYTGDFLSNATAGDLLLLARTVEGKLFGLIFAQESGWLRAAQVLFDFSHFDVQYQLLTAEKLNEHELELVRRRILDELELEISIPPENVMLGIAERELALARDDGREFPSTKDMSALARSMVKIDASDPDEAVVRWISTEEELFRAMERIIVGERLSRGFGDVDEFMSFSLSVQNRRKSRAGLALQNHLEAVFLWHRLRFTPQAVTEVGHKPDFVFPGEKEYRDPNFESSRLVMLALKSTCKDRWSQILAEAARIPKKHLFTLDQALSADQIGRMHQHDVTLVVPTALAAVYKRHFPEVVWRLSEFVEFIKLRQAIT